MALKIKKPVTPGQRGQISQINPNLNQNLIFKKSSLYLPLSFTENSKDVDFSSIQLGFEGILEKKVKDLKVGHFRQAGRNHRGKITIRGKGGGHKRNYRKISLKRQKLPFKMMVYSIHQDPNRSADLGFLGPIFAMDSQEFQEFQKPLKNLVNSLSSKEKLSSAPISPLTKNFAQIIAPKNLEVGSMIQNKSFLQQRPLRDKRSLAFFKQEIENSYTESHQAGDSMPLYKFPVGSQVQDLELQPGKGGQLVRSAGSQAQIIEKSLEKGLARLRLPSGNQRWIPLTCRGSFGIVGNDDHHLRVLGKAGASRWRGFKPKVRGVAMNPVDHPHAGGEGKTSGGRPSVTPWGRPTHFQKFRKRKINPFAVKLTGRNS